MTPEVSKKLVAVVDELTRDPKYSTQLTAEEWGQVGRYICSPAVQEAIEQRVNPADVRMLRQIIFHTPEEWEASRERLDDLLAVCLRLLFTVENLRSSRAKSLAITKLEEFALWARLAILNRDE